jgi:hypothetical protein
MPLIPCSGIGTPQPSDLFSGLHNLSTGLLFANGPALNPRRFDAFLVFPLPFINTLQSRPLGFTLLAQALKEILLWSRELWSRLFS